LLKKEGLPYEKKETVKKSVNKAPVSILLKKEGVKGTLITVNN